MACDGFFRDYGDAQEKPVQDEKRESDMIVPDPVKWPGLTSFIIERVYQEADERVSEPYTLEEIWEMGKRKGKNETT